MPASTPVYAGQRISASMLGRAIGIFAYKTVSQSSGSSNTTLFNDNDLVLALNGNTTYLVEMVLMACTGGGNGALKWAFTVPSGATGDYISIINGTQNDNGSWTATGSGNHNNGLIIKGLITTVSAGSLQLQWAQNSSNATASTVGIGSYLQARQAL